jgi:outer membrane protein assembly factor BamA
LYPGNVLTRANLEQAEKNLARLNLFESNAETGVKPTVAVLDNPADPDNPVKDVLVTVKEANTGSLMFGVGFNSSGGLSGTIVFEERNFDIHRWPTCLGDIRDGSAFRGAGQVLRIAVAPLELSARVSLLPAGLPDYAKFALLPITHLLFP